MEDVETISVEEFSSLLHAASKDILPSIVLGGFCGLRSAEIERLHWGDVHLTAGEVKIRRATAKTKSRRIVPLCDAAREWLADFAKETGPIWKGTHEDFYEAKTDAAKAAGIAWKPNVLRHGYGTYRLAVTKDATKVSYEMGNSPKIVHEHYANPIGESEGKAWFALLPTKPANVVELTRATAAPTKAPEAARSYATNR